MSLSNFVIHIDENLDASKIDAVENVTGACLGVVSANINNNRPHLMVVTYDPRRGCSTHILGALQSMGLNGQLIGL